MEELTFLVLSTMLVCLHLGGPLQSTLQHPPGAGPLARITALCTMSTAVRDTASPSVSSGMIDSFWGTGGKPPVEFENKKMHLLQYKTSLNNYRKSYLRMVMAGNVVSSEFGYYNHALE